MCSISKMTIALNINLFSSFAKDTVTRLLVPFNRNMRLPVEYAQQVLDISPHSGVSLNNNSSSRTETAYADITLVLAIIIIQTFLSQC